MQNDAQRAVFLDKDGTLVVDVPYNVDCARIQLAPGALPAARRLAAAGFLLVVVTNQSGVALGYYDEADVLRVGHWLRETLGREGIHLAGFYYCPHHPAGTVPRFAGVCSCRKPAAGMLRRAAADLRIDPSRSWMIGDILDDVEAGHRFGCRSILVDNGGETQWRRGPGRWPDHVVPHLGAAAEQIIAQEAPFSAPAGQAHRAPAGGCAHDRQYARGGSS